MRAAIHLFLALSFFLAGVTFGELAHRHDSERLRIAEAQLAELGRVFR